MLAFFDKYGKDNGRKKINSKFSSNYHRPSEPRQHPKPSEDRGKSLTTSASYADEINVIQFKSSRSGTSWVCGLEIILPADVFKINY